MTYTVRWRTHSDYLRMEAKHGDDCDLILWPEHSREFKTEAGAVRFANRLLAKADTVEPVRVAEEGFAPELGYDDEIRFANVEIGEPLRWHFPDYD